LPSNLLFGVPAIDVTVFAALVLAATAFVACYLPAIVVLRFEYLRISEKRSAAIDIYRLPGDGAGLVGTQK
jgi:hypothetical protein